MIQIDLPLEEMCEKLTMSGLEVEHVNPIESIKGGLKNLVVGEVISVTNHPNADSLNLTTVSIGKPQLLSIVCGAKNIAKGQKVVVAPIGTTLYKENDSFKIKKAKIRGEISEGMICAEDEIGLGNNHDGIMVLDAKLVPGSSLTDIYPVENDYQIEIAIIPNRGDAISHMGIARELQALTGTKYKKPTIKKLDTRGTDRVKIIIRDFKACPRYAGISISSVKVKQSPDWLKKRLQSLDLKPINVIVDISNFIMHEIGQPIHIFDADKISEQQIIPRFAKKGEKIITLDQVERELSEDHFIISDSEKPIAIAGVLGGLSSSVSENTQNIFIESAYFDPSTIRKTAKKLGLNTDASYRFERGTDPEMVEFALTRAANLILELSGGDISSDIQDIYPDIMSPRQIEINFNDFNAFIGYEIPKETALEILHSLEIKIIANNDINVLLEVPRYRTDIERPVDIYEEIIRIFGFNNIPIPEKVNYVPSVIEKNTPHKLKTKISNYLSAIGFNEIMNNSLIASRFYEEQDLNRAIRMMNPLSNDMDILRMDLLNSALSTISYNLNRKNTNLKFFEFGKTYFKVEKQYHEKEILQLTFTGNRHPEHWSTTNTSLTDHELRAIVTNIGKKLNISESDMESIITYDTITSQQKKHHGLKQDVISLHIDWEACMAKTNVNIKLKDIPVFPIVRRDLSIVLDQQVAYKAVTKIAKSCLHNKLKDILLFDVYQGKPLNPDQRSFSVAFYLYDENKTMEDAEIDQLMQKLIQNLEESLHAVIRK